MSNFGDLTRNMQNAIDQVSKVQLKPLERIIAEENYADKFCKELVNRINEFNSKLDNDKQVAIRLVSFGQNITLIVNSLGYKNPSLVYFRGVTENGDPVELIQHISQISFLLLATQRKSPEQPKRPIGFFVSQ